MTIKIYVEGGGNNKSQKSECRRGFSEFIRKIGLSGRMPSVVACGSRDAAFEMFCTALKTADHHDLILLLVDSEAPVDQPGRCEFLSLHDAWDIPAGVSDSQVHLMVQCMEAWFLADRDTLRRYYGHHVNTGALPRNQAIEEIDKSQLMTGLRNATRNTQKGAYSKGGHSFDLLAQIDPDLVSNASPHARAWIMTLKERASS